MIGIGLLALAFILAVIIVGAIAVMSFGSKKD
jgi:hypothetical protein